MSTNLKGNAAWRSLSDDEPDGKTDISACQSILRKLGFTSSDQVTLSIIKPQVSDLDPEEARRLAIRHSRKGHYGRRGMPPEFVQTMYRTYQRLGSTSKVAAVYGRTRQAVWGLFKSHGLAMNDRNLHVKVHFNGTAWTPGKNGYYRATSGDRNRKLHYEIWMLRTGRMVPPGFQVTFKDGDNTNFLSENLVCLPIAEVTLLHYRRRFPSRAGLPPEARRDFWRAHNRAYMQNKRKNRRHKL